MTSDEIGATFHLIIPLLSTWFLAKKKSNSGNVKAFQSSSNSKFSVDSEKMTIYIWSKFDPFQIFVFLTVNAHLISYPW